MYKVILKSKGVSQFVDMAPGEHHHRFLNSVLGETVLKRVFDYKRGRDWCDGRTTLSVCP